MNYFRGLRATIVWITLFFGLSSAIAVAEDPKPDDRVYFPANVFIEKPNVSITEQVLHTLATEFPALPILTQDNSARPPETYVILLEPTPREFGVPDERRVKFMGIGLSPEETKSLINAQSIWGAMFVTSHGSAITQVKMADRFMLRLAELSDGVLYDGTTRRYYSQKWWKENRLPAWEGDTPDARRFVFMDFYKPGDGPYFRSISLGMSKFGLADVVVSEMVSGNSGSMETLMNVSMQTMIEGRMPAKNGNAGDILSVDLAKIRHAGFKKVVESTLLDGATKTLDLPVKPAVKEDGDPEGPVLELNFEPLPGKSNLERQDAALAKLFGSKDHVQVIQHDAELLAASAKAKGELPALRERFLKGFPLGSIFYVKGPFATRSGGDEWMWVEVTGWPEGKLEGILSNDPNDVPELKAGAKVTVRQADVFDYLLKTSDGKVEGGGTNEILRRRMKDQ
jgi:hypothetical protein